MAASGVKPELMTSTPMPAAIKEKPQTYTQPQAPNPIKVQERPNKAGEAIMKQEAAHQTVILTDTWSPGYQPLAYIQPRNVPPTNTTPAGTLYIRSKRDLGVMEGRQKYHHKYFGSWHCGRTLPVPYEEWKLVQNERQADIPDSRDWRKHDLAVMEGRQKTVYKPRKGPTKCGQCHQVRDKQHHHQCFGSWHCGRTHPVPFEEWKVQSERRADRAMPAAKENPKTHTQPQVPNLIKVQEHPNEAGQATLKREAAQQTIVLTDTWSPSNRNVPLVNTTPASTFYSRRKRGLAVMKGRQKKVYKLRKGPTICGQCHQLRDKQHHHKYYGSWHCGRTHPVPYEEWKLVQKERRADNPDSRDWHNKRSKERQTLEMAVSVAKPKLVTSTPMPAAKEKPQTHTEPQVPNLIKVQEHPKEAGQATLKGEAAQQTFVLTDTWSPGYRPLAYIQPASLVQPRNVPPVTPASTLYKRKKRDLAVMEGRQKTLYKPRKGPTICKHCQQARDNQHHHQYYGNWHCERTNPLPYEEWKQLEKVKRNDNRKKQKKE